MSQAVMHNFTGRRAIVLHHADEPLRRISERCARLGVAAVPRRDTVGPACMEGIDMVILDIDTGHDAQLPWAAGQAPVPVVGLIGSESPGRLAWALGQQVDAFLPLSAIGTLFSALVIAHDRFAAREAQRAREAELAAQRSGRLDVIRAVLALMEGGRDEALALKQLRAFAMVERIPIEDAARRVLAQHPATRAGKR
ncbi:transcriptional antiterminator [Palleronia sediminis]|uniref:Transcriptional antiterminator n=1 Tax=Palleronia sediminis TaxID=2547833 RepID=A0A4R6A5I4_9RHOB|nr:transcriptional antiterminator [Palleronia sediminis]TDL78105.1 transcriptional antiterminator [Palleronia sediminis]